jgi:hypothetical protein
MAAPEEKRFKFFVYVVESPSPLDLYHRRSEGEIIRKAVNLNQIPCSVVTAINLDAFEASLKIGLPEAMSLYKNLNPILHISAHGNEEGIQLSSGQVLQWAVLRQYLLPINTALNNNLLVCMSCCKGYSGTRMAMFVQDAGYPFYAIVANSEDPLWADTAVAYSTFYHLLGKGEYVVDAVQAMRVASGNDTFFVNTAEQSRQGYIEYLAKLNPAQVQQKLEDNISKEEPEHVELLRKVGGTITP